MKIKVYRFNDHDGDGGLVVKDPEQLVEELRACEVDDGPYWIYIEEKEESVVDNLPDWDGF